MTMPFVYLFLGLFAVNCITGILFKRKPSDSNTNHFYNGRGSGAPMIQGTQAYVSHFVVDTSESINPGLVGIYN